MSSIQQSDGKPLVRHSPLLRSQAGARRNGPLSGSPNLPRPRAVIVLTIAAAASFLLLTSLFFGHGTRRTTVHGVLVPQRGLIRVQPPQNGVVLERRVDEGQIVREDDVLFVISAERGSIQLDSRSALQSRGQAVLATQIADLSREREKLDAQIEAQEHRLMSVSETIAHLEKLRTFGVGSETQLKAAHDERRERQAQLHALRRSRGALMRELSQARAQRNAWPLDGTGPLLETDIAGSEEQLPAREAGRKLVITAGRSGIVTAITAEPGQIVTAGTKLANIVPLGTVLEARLYAPGDVVRLIEPGRKVLVCHRVYPYEKFDQHAGIVTAVAKTPASAEELAALANLPAASSRTEPMYRITVALNSQTVAAYGRDQPLLAGMRVGATLLLEHRRLIDWILEPSCGGAGRR